MPTSQLSLYFAHMSRATLRLDSFAFPFKSRAGNLANENLGKVESRERGGFIDLGAEGGRAERLGGSECCLLPVHVKQQKDTAARAKRRTPRSLPDVPPATGL